MDNASLYYNETNNYADIQELIGTTEEIFIDFKQTASRTGRMTDDDKANFSKAASGFAHQEGGVLIWGISTEEEGSDVGRAVALKPISNVGAFCSALRNYIRHSTEPVVDGIQQKVIHEHDSEESDTGFVVSFFPKSYEVHRSLGPGKTKNAFYKRYGDGFHTLATNEIKALFFRTMSPDLELTVVPDQHILRLLLKNNGKGIARNCAIHIGLKRGIQVLGRWYDGEGNTRFKVTQVVAIPYPLEERKYTHQVRLNPGIVVFPEEEVSIAEVSCGDGHGPIDVEYRIFSENMLPKEGRSTLQNPGRIGV